MRLRMTMADHAVEERTIPRARPMSYTMQFFSARCLRDDLIQPSWYPARSSLRGSTQNLSVPDTPYRSGMQAIVSLHNDHGASNLLQTS